MLGGQLIAHFNAGDVIEGTFRVQQLQQWGAPNVNWVDTAINGGTWAIPANVLTQVSASNSIPDINNIPAPVKGLLGLAAIFIFLKVVKVI